jgi:signal transduction histidine kinase
VLLVWALENLVKNALDALAGGGGGYIRIAVAAIGPDRIQFSITDTGPGIAHAVRGRIFEPGVSTKIGGWGVGLSLTRRIIEELHGGRITVEARRGGGTIFKLDLPAARMPISAEERMSASVGVPLRSPGTGGVISG